MASPLLRQITRILQDNGCVYEKPGKGDHQIWYSPITKRRFTVDAGIKSRFTANNIMKDAGISHRF